MDIATVDRFVEDQRDKHRIPGMMLALFEDGEVVYTKGDGAADSARPMSVEVAMPVGSVTRSFTAVLQLVERGQVTLDAPVRTYLSWFQVADDAASEAITATMARIKKSKSVRRWNDLSPGQQTVLLTRRSPSSLAVTAWTDLAFRPAAQVNNRKALWAAIIAINFAGPVLYFWRGIDR